jgi:hypothetical protein
VKITESKLRHCALGPELVHFYGADALSFADGVRLRDRDVMRVTFAGFGRPLWNPLVVESGPEASVGVRPL